MTNGIRHALADRTKFKVVAPGPYVIGKDVQSRISAEAVALQAGGSSRKMLVRARADSICAGGLWLGGTCLAVELCFHRNAVVCMRRVGYRGANVVRRPRLSTPPLSRAHHRTLRRCDRRSRVTVHQIVDRAAAPPVEPFATIRAKADHLPGQRSQFRNTPARYASRRGAPRSAQASWWGKAGFRQSRHVLGAALSPEMIFTSARPLRDGGKRVLLPKHHTSLLEACTCHLLLDIRHCGRGHIPKSP